MKTKNNKTEITTKKSAPMIVLTDDQRDYLNQVKEELELKNQHEALEVIIEVANNARGKGAKDQFVIQASQIKSARAAAKNETRIAELRAELQKLEEAEAALKSAA